MTKSASEKQKVSDGDSTVATGLPLREPSTRNTRVIHPGLVAAPRHKSAHDEVQAELAAKADAASKLACQWAEAVASIVAIDVMLDEAAAVEAEEAIDELADLHEDNMDVDNTPGDAEDTELYLEFTEEDFGPSRTTMLTSLLRSSRRPGYNPFRSAAAREIFNRQKKKKPTKGQTRTERGCSQAGLSKHWLTSLKAAEDDGDDQPESQSPKLGGLTNNDVAAIHPVFGAKLPGSKAPQKNEVITIDGSSDADEILLECQPRSKPSLSVLVVRRGWPSTQYWQDASKTHKHKHIKSESLDSSVFTPDSAADVNGLPAFIAPTWSSIFLAARYRELDHSEDPMALELSASQLILDKLLWPRCKPYWTENTLGTSIGQAGLTVTDQLYQKKEYIGNPEAIQKAATYAPVGYLESKLVIQTIAPFMKNCSFAIPELSENGYDFSQLPIGFLGMAAAAVESALLLYSVTGIRVEKPPDFSSDTSATAVGGYIKNIRLFTKSRWESIIDATSADVIETVVAPIEVTIALDVVRDSMYTPSSP
ncbi:hypothetical protein B0H10DRAFT_1940426 [Mycena sp. CBHHK59/15]|nr:hypothetical protein B0H10DRAFT_1940426 [Mycena sp. CBHHK59/15]